MKTVFVLIMLCVVGIYAVYKFGFADFDPKQQAVEFKHKVQVGMSWEQLIEIRKPKKVACVDFESEDPMDLRVPFDAEKMRKQVADKQFDGYTFEFNFSNTEAYGVSLDENGKVTGVSSLMTTGDLFKPPGMRR
jgi:hypothetical protein